jgi:1,4-dihydroxy-6-naphthoate synthase
MLSKHFKIGFSPCPNDTFIFDALVNHKIDTGNLVFEPVIEDVETLNKLALKGILPVSKLSFGVLPLVLDKYILLNSGSALGKGVGPLLIAKDSLDAKEINECVVAIPGEYTTAHVLFSLAYPGVANKVFLRYDEIEDFVLYNKGLGVIIHENRFTYEAKGLKKITDLGDYWQMRMESAIPLGGIVVKRSIPLIKQLQIEILIRQSLEFALIHYPQLFPLVREHAREMDDVIMRKHIELYVNDFTSDLGEAGRQAVEIFINTFNEINHREASALPLFVKS